MPEWTMEQRYLFILKQVEGPLHNPEDPRAEGANEGRLEVLLDSLGDLGQCRSCHAHVYWLKHRNGKKAPYNGTGKEIGLNHFSTCPNAQRFRKKQ